MFPFLAILLRLFIPLILFLFSSKLYAKMGSPPNYFILLLLDFWLEKWKTKVVA